MKTTSHPAPKVKGFSFHRIAMIAFAATALLAIFARPGAPSPDELVQVADAAPAPQRLSAGEAGASAAAHSESTAPAPQWLDAAVLAHEALDPVGSGLRSRP